MPGPNFAALAVGATAAIDNIMAEPFAFTPMMKPADKTAADVADSSRAVATVNAIYLDRDAKSVMPNSYDPREQRRPGLESGTPRLWISPNEIANQTAGAGAPFIVHAGDQFERLSTGITYRISSVKPTAGGAFRCEINVLG